MKQVVNVEARRDLMAEVKAAGNLLNGVKCHLFKADALPITEQTTLAEVAAHEANFDGYAPSGVITWGAVFEDTNGVLTIYGIKVEFPCTGNTTPQLIGGAYLTLPAVVGPPAVPEDLRLILVFDPPVPVNAAGQGVELVPTFTYP